jgi:hypothetical protein
MNKFLYVLLIILIIYYALMALSYFIKEQFVTGVLDPSSGAPVGTGNGVPNYMLMGFRDTSLRSNVIADRPRPPDIGYTGYVIYSPVDLASDVKKLKNDIIQSEMKERNRVSLQISNAVPVEVGKALEKWRNCPLMDTMYGK